MGGVEAASDSLRTKGSVRASFAFASMVAANALGGRDGRGRSAAGFHRSRDPDILAAQNAREYAERGRHTQWANVSDVEREASVTLLSDLLSILASAPRNPIETASLATSWVALVL